MNPSSDLCFGKTPLTPSHGDSLVDQSFQSLKSKEVRDSESPLRDIKFRNSGGVAGGVLVPDTTGWNVQTSSEVSPDGRAFRTETLAKTDGVEKIPGGRAEFAGRNEQKSSASHQGDDKNYVKKAAESSKTHLQENIVVGDANSGRTEVKSSSVTSSSSKVVSSSSQVISSGDPGFDMEPRRLTHDPQFQKLVSSANNTALHSDQQQYQRSERNERNERNETTSNLREESLKYVDMDKASPEYQQHVQHLMSQPGAIVSNIVEYPKPGVKMITTVKKLPDGTTVKTKRYETEASADSGSISQTMNQQQRMSSSSSTTQKTTEKRIQDSEDVFSRLSRTRDSSAPMSPQKTPETPSQDDIYSRLQKSRGGNVHEQTFSEAMDQRSTQILRDTNQHPVTRTVPTRRASDLVDNVEVVSTNNTVKKDLNQSVRNEKITDFIQTERDRFVLDRESPSRSGPDGLLNTLAPITPGRFVRPQTEDISTNGYTSTGVIQQSSKSSTKFSESRRFSTETVESFAESHNENQDFSTHGFPSVRRPIEEPKGGRSPSGGRPSQDFSTHGFPSVRPDKPTQQYTSQRPSTNEEYSTTERVHIVNNDRPRPGEAYPQTKDSTSTTRSNFSTNETRRHITSTTDDFSTHGFPSVRAGTPTRDSPKRFEPSLSESPRRPSGQEPVGNRRSPSDGYSTHGFPSVKASSPSGESPRRPSGAEPTNQGQRPTTDDYSTHGFPSAKPGHTTPTQSAPQYEDSPRPTNRRQPSVDRDDTISVSSDRSNSITYEKRIDAAHQAFARSLRCASPVESIRRDSISDRTTPRTSVGSIRNSYSPSKRDGRSPSHESITNSESSRISSATVTKTHRPVTTDTRRVSGPKSPISKTVPSRVSNETIDYSLTRKITAKPTDKTTGRPTPGTTPNTSRRPYNTEEEINTLLDTATKHTTPTTRSAKTQDTKPTKTDTLYSSKPKTKPEGYISQNRATDITEKHNQTTNKQVSYPHYIPSVPKADRSSPSDRPTKNASSPAPTTTSTTPHTAPKSATEKPKVAPSTSPTTKPSSSSPSTRFTKTVKDENAITRDTTKTRREPEAEYLPEDLDEGYVPDTKGQRRPTSKRPTSDDEGFEPESPRAGSPTSDFEYRRPTQTETFDEEDSIFNRTRKTDKKTVTTDFLDTERRVKQTRRPEDGDRPAGPTDSEPEDGGRKPSYLTNEPTSPSAVKQPRHPGDKEPKRPEEISPKPTHANRVPNGPSGVKQPIHPGDVEPVGPSGPSANEPKRPNDGGRKPHYLTDEPSGTHINQPRHPGDVNKQKRPEDKGRTPLYDEHTCGEPKRPEDGQQPGKPRGSKPPLDRSETFDERCRQILGMQDETTVEKASRVQDFINTERNTVNIIRKPGQRSPSPQKKQPSDTVSIEDCDDEDYPSQNTTTRTTKTTKVEYPRGTSPTEKPVGRGSKPGDKETGDYPRDRSPLGKTPKGIRPSETDETTVTTTTTTRSVDRPRGGSPLGPRGRSPPHSETTVRKTTIRDTNIVDEIDERSPSSRPRDGSPMDKKPIGTRPTDEPTTTTTTTTSNTTYEADRPFSKSPLKKPVRGSSPTDETFTSRTTTRDTTIQESVDDVFGLSRPRDRFSPDEPRDRSPTDETTVRRTTTTKTRGTTDDDRSPHRRDYPRERSPRDTPRGGSPTNDTTVKRTTKSTRDTTIIADIEDRSPSSRPRGQSPNEKPRGRSPINDNTYRTITTTTRDILIDDDSLRPRDYTRDRSPIEKLRGPSPTDNRAMKNTTKTTKTTTVISDVDKRPHGRSPSPTRGPRPTYVDDIVTETTTTSDKIVRPPGRSPTESDTKDGPHNQSPSDKPRRQTPFVSENIDETYVQKTSNTIKGTTTLKEFDVDDTSPHKKPTRRPSPTEETGDHPRGKSPVKPKGGRQYEAYETTVTDVTVVDERNKRPSDRSPSPRSKLTDKYPRGSRPTEEEKSPRNKSPEKKPTSSLRDTSPSEKPRRKYPNDGDTEETIVQMTSKTTDKRTFEETDVENYPRTKSPSEKPKGRRPSGETINDRSPKGSPRGTSPTEKPRRRQQTDEEIDITVIQRTTKTTKEETTDQSPKERYPQNRPRETSPSEKPTPKDYPRDKSPTEKPRGTRPSNETVTQRTLKKTTDISTVDNRSPKTSPRGSSPTEKPRRHQPNDEKIDTTLVQKTSKITRDNRTLEETVVKDRSLKDYPREKSPRRRQPSEEDTDDTITSDCNSPISRPRGTSSSNKPRRRHPSEEETDETFVQTTIKTTIVDDHSRETSPSAKPRERQPIGEEPNESTNKSPKDHPRERSPSKISTTEKPRGPISTDETFVQKTVKTTTDRITTADRSPKDRPRGISPTEKPRRRQPTDEEIDVTVVQKTTKTTRGRTTLEKSPSRSPKEHPRDRSPSERPKGPRATDENVVQRTTKTTTVEDRSSKGPRGTSPSEKPRGPRTTNKTILRRTVKSSTDHTTVEDRPSEDETDEIDETIDETTTTESVLLKDRPRGTSPSEKPRRHLPTDEDTEETVVHRTFKTTRDRTTMEEVNIEDSPRDRSPSESPRGHRPMTDDCSPRNQPRETSPSEKPRRRQPTDEEIDFTVLQMTTKTTKDKTTLEETTGRSPKDRPREKSPLQKPGLYPRDNSPTEKPRGLRPTSETVVQRTTKTTTDRTTVDDRSPKDRPRAASPSQKPVRRQPTNEEIDVTVVQMSTKTTKDRTTLEETTGRSPKDRPREKSPSQKPGSYPRDNSPTEKPRGPRPTSETVVQRTTKTTTDRTIVDDRSPKDRPRGISHSEKPRSHRPSEDETDETDEIDETINEITTTERVLLKDRPRGTSPSEKPRRRHPTDEDTEETIVRRTTVTRDRTTMEEVNIEDSPRDRSPSESPRGRRPTTDDCSPRNQPRETSPSEKPRRRQPTVEEIDVTVLQRATKTTNDRTTLEETTDRSPKDRPREKSQSQKPGSYPRDNSPTEKPRGPRRTSETVVQRTTKTTTDRTTVDDRLPKDLPRATSPSEKPRRRQPTEEEIDVTMVQRTTKTTKDRTTLEKKRDRLPAEKPGSRTYPRDNSPTENHRSPMPTRETVIQRNVKTTTDSITVDDHSPDNRYRGTSPSEKPWERRPSEEETEEAITETSIETTTFEGERPRPHDQSSTEKPNSRTYPHETAPLRKPQRPTNGEIDETVILTTFTTRQGPTFDDRHPEGRPVSPSGKPRGPNGSPRGTSPSDKPRRYLPSDDEIDETYVRRTTKTTREDHTHEGSPTSKPSSKPYPRDDSPTDKLRRPKTTDVDETTVRNTTTRTTVQETDFEKRYPKGREQSPVGKPTTRRPSKPTTTTTTTRNRSTLEEQDLSRSPRPKTQPATRDKAPTKTISTYPRSQPTTERRVPAELPSLGRKPVPKTTFGSTTKTTTQTTVTRVPATRPKTTKEMPKKPSKLVSGPSELRPGARQPERKHSPSISPDSSPSRPTSEVDLQSPYRSPNTSPSRKSPSPTRSVKLEDITSSVVTTKKTTVSIDKSKPKITHTTTAKFQVSPPTSPTKVISSSEIKYSPSKKPPTKATTPKPTVSRVTTTKKSTTVRKDVVIPTDSERDSEVPTDLEDVDSPLAQKSPTRKLPVTHRKESAPVHRVTQIDRDVQKMARSTSENIIKTPVIKRPLKNEPLEPISQGKTSPKTERRPSKHLSTKTINLTTFDKVINSQDMEDVMVIDIQHAKSSREPSPNKIVPTPVSVDLYTGKPRYPDVVQEPEDEPRKKPTVKNIPIFEEETNDFVGCQITEVNESFENTTKHRTRKFIDGETRPQRPTPIIVTGDNVDNECLLSVHDKVSKFISTAEEVSRPKTSAPFRRDVPEEDIPDDDECLLTVDEKVNKFLKTAESVTKEVMTSSPKPIERPRIDDLDEDLRTDECVLSVSEKVNKFTTKAEKLAPSAPQRSPELVARIERQISRQSEPEPESPRDVRGYPESPDGDDSPTTVRKVKQTKSLFEREEKKYTDRQIDILSRPSVWDKKPKPEVNLNDILGYKPDDERVEETPRRKSPIKDQPDVAFSKPSKPLTDTISKRKEVFENKTSTHKITSTTKPGPHSPTYSRKPYKPSDESDSQYPSEFPVKYVDGYPQEPDDVHEDVYGSSKTRCLNETSTFETTRTRQSPERSPTRKSSHPEIRPSPRTSTRTPKQPEDHSPSRRYSDDHSPRHSTDLYTKTSETSEYTTRRRSSTQKYPEDHSPKRRTPHDNTPSPSRKQPVDEPEDYTFSSMREETNKHHTTRTSYRSPKDTTPLTPTSIPDDEDHDHSPARSTSTVSSQKRTTTHRSTTNRLTEDTTSRRPRRPSGNEPSTPTSLGRGPKSKGVPETVAARRNIFESSPGDVSPKLGNRRPSYMDHTKSSLEHTRKDSLEITKTNYSRKSSMEEEPYEPSPRSAVKFGVGLKHKDEPKPKRKLSSSDIPNIEDVFELDLLEEMLNIVTLYEQRRRIRAQIRVVKKLLETKTKEEVSKMTKITTFRKTSSSSISDSPIPRRDTSMRPDRYQPSDDIDSESIVESRHVEEHEEIIRERSISPQTKTTKKITKVTEVRRIGEPTTSKRTAPKKDEPKDSKPIWATKNILKKPSENEKVARVLSAKKTTSTSSSSTSRTQQSHRQRVPVDEDCITSSYGIGPTDDDGRPLFGIRALKKKATTTSKTAQPSETTKVTGTVITEKYYSENGAKPVGERKVTVYSTNPEDLVDMETQYDRRDSETVKRERLSKDGLTSVTKVQKIGKYKPGEIPALTDDDEFGKTTSKMVRRGSVKEMSEKFIRKESSSSVTEKSSGYPKAGLILRTRTNSGATADAADQYEVRAKSTEYDDESENECDVEIRTSRKHSKVVTESEDETEIRRKVNTRSFLNSGGSKVTGVDDVLDRMRNADNVVVDGDTLEDREARSLLNKFLGASVLMTGMESIIPQRDLKRTTAGDDHFKKQGVKTTRVTKTTKSAAVGGSSSSPVARETCDFEEIWDEETLKELLEKSTSYEERRSIRARLRQLMADREGLSTTTTEKTETKKEDGGVVTTTTKVTTRTITGAPKPVSPFAKFQQLDKQSSLQSPKSPLTPTTPGGSSSTPIFRFTDPALNARAATVKDQLLQWCQSKTQEYENVQITNFSASWTDGLAFCALIHHFLPDAFDYSKLTPKQRRYNFELAFRVADEKAGIAPLLDVEDMVVMKRPDWKCVFTYVQSIYRRFRNCQ